MAASSNPTDNGMILYERLSRNSSLFDRCVIGRDTLTASASGSDLDVAGQRRLASRHMVTALPIERSPEHHVTGRRAVIFRESRVNVLTLSLALALERACPSMAWHRDPEGAADSRKGLSELNQAMGRPEGTRANAAAPLLWCLPLFQSWHELVKKGGRSRSAPPEMV